MMTVDSDFGGLINRATMPGDVASTLVLIGMLGMWLIVGTAIGIGLLYVAIEKPGRAHSGACPERKRFRLRVLGVDYGNPILPRSRNENSSVAAGTCAPRHGAGIPGVISVIPRLD